MPRRQPDYLRPHEVPLAIAASPSDLVFPKADGTRMRADVNLEWTLRRALGRAGVVEGHRHVCRRKGCGHAEPAQDQAQRRCPTDHRKLWVKPVVRPIRFHDLRHSTASLLMMNGANPASVQRILRPYAFDNSRQHLVLSSLQAWPTRARSAERLPRCGCVRVERGMRRIHTEPASRAHRVRLVVNGGCTPRRSDRDHSRETG